MCSKEHEWDKVIPFILMAYRATSHSAATLTPNFLMFGRECHLPVHVVFPPPISDSDLSYHQYAAKLENRLAAASELARLQLMLNWDKMQSYAPVSRSLPQFSHGPTCPGFDPSTKPGYSPKLSSVWKGPFRLVAKISDLLYKIDFGGRKAGKVIHRSHIYQPQIREGLELV